MHGLAIQAIAMAESLDLLPAKLIIYAIAGSNFEMTDTLSPDVMQAVKEVSKALLQEEDVCPCRR